MNQNSDNNNYNLYFAKLMNPRMALFLRLKNFHFLQKFYHHHFVYPYKNNKVTASIFWFDITVESGFRCRLPFRQIATKFFIWLRNDRSKSPDCEKWNFIFLCTSGTLIPAAYHHQSYRISIYTYSGANLSHFGGLPL